MRTLNTHKILYAKLSYLIVGVCFEAHNELGRYSKEKQYANYIEKIFKEDGIKYNRELALGDTGNIIDFLVDDKIILEIKAKNIIGKTEYFQVKKYLIASNLKLGILVNFREKYLKPKRIINSQSKN